MECIVTKPSLDVAWSLDSMHVRVPTTAQNSMSICALCLGNLYFPRKKVD